MQSRRVRFILLFGTLCIIAVALVQYYWLRKAFDIKEKQFSQTVNVALIEVADQLCRYNKTTFPNESPVKQITPDYFVVNINSVIDANVLEHYLRTYFQYHSILSDFEYAIYDCSSEQMVYGDYISMTQQSDSTNRTKNLKKLDQYTYYFGVFFPHKRGFLIGEINVWIGGSLVILVAVLFMTYAMFVILKQKRLADIQKDFLDNMTHEFKTPIATIGVAVEVLGKPDITQNATRMKNYVRVIKEENRRLKEQVEKLLNFASIERSSFVLNKQEVDLHIIIRKAMESFDVKDEKVIECELQAANSLIYADEFHLTNAIYNLVDNAIKYSDKPAKIIIRTTKEKHLILSVSDNGQGIPKAEQKQIFKKFYRVQKGNVHDVKGFGLGLSYVQTVVRSHRWKLELTSELGEGSTFSIVFK